MATAGSKEARAQEKVKKVFAEVYRESGAVSETGTGEAQTRYSISETTDGRLVAVVDNDILSHIDTTSWDNTKKDEAKKAASDALKQFCDGGLEHPRKDSFVDFDRGTTLICAGRNKYTATVLVGITNTSDAVLYDVVGLKPTSFEIKETESPTAATTQKAIGAILGDSVADSVAQKVPTVNTSISENAESDQKNECP